MTVQKVLKDHLKDKPKIESFIKFAKERNYHITHKEVPLGEHFCEHCGGIGKVRDYKERDPIEGYKMANWYPCMPCNSSGKVSKKYVKDKYESYKIKQKLELDEWQKDHDLLTETLNKISDKDIEILRDFI